MKFLRLISPLLFNLLGGVSPLLLSIGCLLSPTLAADNIVLKLGPSSP
jgi:hypothetical protein